MIKSPLYEGSFLSLSAGERYENHFDFSGIAESGTIVIFTISKSKMLRHVQKQQALENKKNGRERQLHPKLQQLKNLRIN